MTGRHVEVDATPSVQQIVAELEAREAFLRHPTAPPTADGAHVRPWRVAPTRPSSWLGAGIIDLDAMTRQQATPRDAWSADPDRTTRRWASA